MGDGLLEEAAAAGRPLARFWEPERPVVVLGRADVAEREVRLEACRAAGIDVVKRRGGGGTVLLARGMLVLTLAGPAGLAPRPRRTFARLNGWIAEGLVAAGCPPLRQRGLSDLCVGDRKVLGCSLAFSRGHLIYQGSLLVDPDLDLLARCLRHPGREPDYRQGRSHAEFLTTLAREGVSEAPGTLAERFRARFEADPPLPVDSPPEDAPRDPA